MKQSDPAPSLYSLRAISSFVHSFLSAVLHSSRGDMELSCFVLWLLLFMYTVAESAISAKQLFAHSLRFRSSFLPILLPLAITRAWWSPSVDARQGEISQKSPYGSSLRAPLIVHFRHGGAR